MSARNDQPEENRTLARLLYTGAVGFLETAKAAHERHLNNTREPEHWPAISVNLCFTLELSLKAFMAMRGTNRAELKKDIGHNLNKGLERAQAVGYTPSHKAVNDLIAHLSPLHMDFSLRYLENKSTDLPETRNMIAIIERHVRDVGAQMPIKDL